MTVESAADRATMLADFGDVVTWTVGATPSTLTAIFERPTVDGQMAEIDMINRDATLKCCEADVPDGADEGDAIAIAGEPQAFTVKVLRPDGQGMVVVDLKKA